MMCDNLAQMLRGVACLLYVAASAAAATFQDPAPPQLLAPAPSAAVVAKPHPRVTYRKAPKPLSSAAKVHTWA